jgi:CTP synthase (UTP-ammonia lyase)
MIPSRGARSCTGNDMVGIFREAVTASAAIMALALLAVSFSSRPAQAYETAHELAAQCKSIDTSTLPDSNDVLIPGTKGALQCWGYMQAMQDLFVLVDEDGRRIMGVCPNEQTSLLQMTRAFVAYADRHSSDLHNDAALIVVQALKETFPCP